MIVRNNKSQAFLQVKVKENFSPFLNSTATEGKEHGIEFRIADFRLRIYKEEPAGILNCES